MLHLRAFSYEPGNNAGSVAETNFVSIYTLSDLGVLRVCP